MESVAQDKVGSGVVDSQEEPLEGHVTLPEHFLRGRSLGHMGMPGSWGLLPLLADEELRGASGHRSEGSGVRRGRLGKLWFGTQATFSGTVSSVPPWPLQTPWQSQLVRSVTGTPSLQGSALHSGAWQAMGHYSSP